jgi:hypothetical protein
MDCVLCRGTGKENVPGGFHPCPRCNGIGTIPDHLVTDQKCRYCNGTARVPVPGGYAVCRICQGFGYKLAAGPTLPLALYVSGQQPEEARQELSTVLEVLRGEVRICDQYYGPGMLSKLRSLEKCSRVRVLTKKLGGPDSVAAHEMQDFKNYYPKMQFKKHAGGGLHDRYIISRDQLLLLGHSLKDFGGSESFVVVLNKEVAGDIMKSVRDSFDEKWKLAHLLA